MKCELFICNRRYLLYICVCLPFFNSLQAGKHEQYVSILDTINVYAMFLLAFNNVRSLLHTSWMYYLHVIYNIAVKLKVMTQPDVNGDLLSYVLFLFSKCKCYSYWSLLLLDFCDPNPCQNSGRCFITESGYRCQCSNGYDGKNCQINTGSMNDNKRSQTYILSTYKIDCK